jgi:hypothetical protein
LASCGCAIASTLTWLLLARGLQGLGAHGLGYKRTAQSPQRDVAAKATFASVCLSLDFPHVHGGAIGFET